MPQIYSNYLLTTSNQIKLPTLVYNFFCLILKRVNIEFCFCKQIVISWKGSMSPQVPGQSQSHPWTRVSKLARGWMQSDPLARVVSMLLSTIQWESGCGDTNVQVHCTFRLSLWEFVMFSNTPWLTLIGFWFHFSSGKLLRRAIFMQRNSAVKLSGSEICVLACEKETVFPSLMNNPCLPHNGHGFIKCAISPSHTYTHVFAGIMIEEPSAAILLEKINNMICVSKHCTIA